MNAFAFDAISIVIDQPDSEFDLVCFAGSGQAPEIYLMLQRSLKFNAQDASLGMGTYYIEWCDQSNSGYGGVAQALLAPSLIEFKFNTAGAEFLGGMEALKISMSLQPDQFTALQLALERVFDGTGCLIVTDA